MKYIRGFLMAWGMFCWIPCPYRQWRQEDRKAQVSMLPLVGVGIGLVLCVFWKVLVVMGAGQFITGVLLTGAYFLLTGFIHLDGFMDCSDAIMPKHPQMEERQRILKDPHLGAFAMICLALMLIVFAGSMIQLAPEFSLKNCALLLVVFAASRFVGAVEVLLSKPMETSQYAVLCRDAEKRDENPGFTGGNTGSEGRSPGLLKDTVPAFIIFIFVFGGAELLISGGSLWALVGELHSNLVALTVLIAAVLIGNGDKRKLGGMNGDISGHVISTSETFGLVVLALIAGM